MQHLTGNGDRTADSVDLFDCASACLHSPSVEEKLTATRHAWAAYQTGRFSLQPLGAPQEIQNTRFPERPFLVTPKRLPKRSVSSLDGVIALLHAIAHIEFTAISLAWDIFYRFRGLPRRFYSDWLKIAHEEAQHFCMVRGRLRELGSDYGMLEAHSGLWEVAEDTADDLLARLALVPRYMEARGLDVTPGMIARLEQAGDEEGAAILKRILEDEIGHVETGSTWFHYVCRERGLAPEQTYFKLLNQYLRGKIRGPFNHGLRERAGFSLSELRTLEMKGRGQ